MMTSIFSASRRAPIVAAALALLVASQMLQAEPHEFVITTAADAGTGSLRHALQQAADEPDQAIRISFGNREGLFASPRSIELNTPLPPIAGDVTIDGFISNHLWTAYGATISGAEKVRIFEILPGATLRLAGITLRHGRAEAGGAILNKGRLMLDGVSLLENRSTATGGAIANFGQADLINSTLAWNRSELGGALANVDGSLRLINITAYENHAAEGAAVWNSAELHLANSILAGDPSSQQCLNEGRLSPESTHNLIEGHQQGCGKPILSSDPGLESLGYYNGPTPVMPLGGDSPVINMGLAKAALDAEGNTLRWDQRGNGDPRFAAGFTDLGAFERQGQLPEAFLVDTLLDNGLRACTVTGTQNCPLRAAVELAAAARDPTSVRFDARIFDQPQTLILDEIPAGTDDLSLDFDGDGAAAVTIIIPAKVAWRARNGIRFEIDHDPHGRNQ
ncbi:MAG: choice-of-anchor Q domain-containing protein [Wenzhouxiangellaceae bacterium]|nr:choice-of-anchor Q domain-containing protein [Wenzhouxiangellaceae bacterium]